MRKVVLFSVCTQILFSVSCSKEKQEISVIENTISSKDSLAVVQRAIEIPQLETYFHQDLPNRKPLILLQNRLLPKEAGLYKFDIDIVVLTRTELTNPAYLEVVGLEIAGDSAVVKLRYDIEGVECIASLKKVDGNWSIKKHLLYEY